MKRIPRAAVLVTALMSLFAAMPSTAGAVTWHNAGATAYTATGGTFVLLTPGGSIHCTDVRVTGTSPPVTTTNDIATLTATLTGCSGLFIPAHGHCAITLTGVSAAPAAVTGIGDVHCVMSIPAVGQLCTVTDTVTDAYTNPVLPLTPGRMHIPHSSGLTVSAAPGSTCVLAGAGTLSAQAWTATNGSGGTGGFLGPRFTRIG